MSATEKIRTRGRPRSFDVEGAIDTAMRLFHARGYDAVGVAELGAELGIRPPSFYAAFGSKAGLFERALERYVQGEANVFGYARAKGGSVADVIEATLARAAQIYPERDGVAGCLVLDGTRNSTDADARAISAEAKCHSRQAIRDFIATENAARAEELARLVTIALEGMSAAARDGADEATLSGFASSIARAFRREISGD